MSSAPFAKRLSLINKNSKYLQGESFLRNGVTLQLRIHLGMVVQMPYCHLTPGKLQSTCRRNTKGKILKSTFTVFIVAVVAPSLKSTLMFLFAAIISFRFRAAALCVLGVLPVFVELKQCAVKDEILQRGQHGILFLLTRHERRHQLPHHSIEKRQHGLTVLDCT